MTNDRTKEIAMTALMAALVFVATYLIKIPNPATGGYSHMGDCMIFLGVVLLGRKNGAIAGALGGALSDLLAGAALWILPTLIIKFILAFIMGTIIESEPDSRKLQLAGAVLGGIFQIVAYTLAKVVLLGAKVAFASLPNVTIQTTVGVVLFIILVSVLSKYAKNLFKREGAVK